MQNVFNKVKILTAFLFISVSVTAQYTFSDPWHTFTTTHGFIKLGPGNGTYAHLNTDRPRFYLNKPLFINEGEISSIYSNSLDFQTSGSTRMTILNSNGNVGINTTNDPQAHLEVEDEEGTGTLLLRTHLESSSGGPGGGGTASIAGPNPSYSISPTGFPASANNTPYALKVLQSDISGSGFNTTFKLHSNGQIQSGLTVDYTNATHSLTLKDNLAVFQNNNNLVKLEYNLPAQGPKMVWTSTQTQPSNFTFAFNAAYPSVADTDILTLSPEGKVAVNTTVMPGNYSFYVGGKILATELTVKLEQDWPDYVFQPGYQKMSLAETEKFIQQEGHLPGVPTAEEVAENGVNVGEMEAILLEKIEELTLELIELKKEVQELKSVE